MTFNIWKLDLSIKNSPTGPWIYVSSCLALDATAALETAKMRHGSDGTYQIYEGF